MSAQKKDAAAGAWASFEKTNHGFKNSNSQKKAQHGSNAHFDEIALAIRGQQAGARFVADVVAPTALPDALYSLVSKHHFSP